MSTFEFMGFYARSKTDELLKGKITGYAQFMNNNDQIFIEPVHSEGDWVELKDAVINYKKKKNLTDGATNE